MLSATMTRPAEATDAELRALAKRIKADLDKRRGDVADAKLAEAHAMRPKLTESERLELAATLIYEVTQ